MAPPRADLPKLCRSLAESGDLSQALTEFVDTANKIVRGSETSLMELARDGRILREVARTGKKPREPLILRVGPEGVSAWVAKFGRPAVVSDNARDSRYVRTDARYRSMIAVPVRQGKRLTGVLACESTRRTAFGPSHVKLLEDLAAVCAVGLHLYQLQERERRELMLFGMLSHLTRVMATMQPAAFVARAADQMRQAFDISFAAVRVADYDREEVVLVSQSASGQAAPVRRLKFGQGLTGKAFKLGEVVNARDVARDPFYVAGVPGVASELCVPVRMGDNCVGILDLQSREPAAFDSDDVVLVETVARLLAPLLSKLPVPRS